MFEVLANTDFAITNESNFIRCEYVTCNMYVHVGMYLVWRPR
jgi:hypothetical protein